MSPGDFPLLGRKALVTGATDGIGRATAVALVRLGADVIGVGRSEAKAADLLAEVALVPSPGGLEVLARDLSSMSEVVRTAREVRERWDQIDLALYAVGVLVTRTQHTAEGLELDFAVGYLGRFLMLEQTAELGLLHPGTRLVNIAASAPRVPRRARVEFSSPEAVMARTGLRSHGQAQLANDLLTAMAPRRHGITTVGYGPGAVDTSIRREIPGLARAVLAPFYARTTRKPEQAAQDVVAALTDPDVPAGSAIFRDRAGPFAPDPYITDVRRQDELLATSRALVERALARAS